MRSHLIGAIVGLSLFALGCSAAQTAAPEPNAAPSANSEMSEASLRSPSGDLTFKLTADQGVLRWQNAWRGEQVIAPSALGLVFQTGRDLNADLVIQSVTQSTFDETWEQP